MSAAAEIPGGAAHPSGGSGEGSPSGKPNGATPAAAPGDFEGKIRAGGEFAVEQVKTHQRRADQLEARQKELLSQLGGENGGLYQLVQQFGADTVATAVQNYAALRSHAKIGKIVTGYETTGQIALDSNSGSFDEEEFLTPEEHKIKALEQRVESLSAQLGDFSRSTGTAALQGHLERFQKEYHVSPEEFSAVKERIEKRVLELARTETGRQYVGSLSDPNKYTDVEMLGIRSLKEVAPNALFEMGERKRLHEQSKVEKYRTDGPSGRSTDGREAPPEIKTALDALRYARAHPDRV